MKLDGKRAVVTGAASGIGKAVAQAFAEAGALVYVADIDGKAGEAAVAELGSRGLAAEFRPLDVTDQASVTALAAGIESPVDIVVNVAGWGRIQPFMDGDQDYWQRIIEINYTGSLRVVQAFLPGMIARSAGKVVNVASDAGRVGSSGEAAYSGAKGGVIAFTKALAREMARHRINVNCVCPGPTDTPLLEAVPEKHREAFLRAIPFRRFAKPSEIADAVLFLASPRSDYITGQVLSVNGGLAMV